MEVTQNRIEKKWIRIYIPGTVPTALNV